MGTDSDNHVCSGGWYNKKFIDVYVSNNYDREKAAKQGEKMVSDILNSIKDILRRLANFLAKSYNNMDRSII